MASRKEVPFGGAGIPRMVSRIPSAACGFNVPVLFDATASSRIKARSLPLTVPAKKLNSCWLRPRSASLSWSMRTRFSDLVTIYVCLIRHVLGHEILGCRELPVTPQPSVFFRTARELQFLGLPPVAWDLLISASAAVAAWAAVVAVWRARRKASSAAPAMVRFLDLHLWWRLEVNHLLWPLRAKPLPRSGLPGHHVTKYGQQGSLLGLSFL